MNQREIALDILYKTIKDNSYSNLLMRKDLNKLPPIQRGLVTTLVNGVLRNYETLIYQFEEQINDKTSLKIKLLLSLAFYERFYLNEKDYVTTNEYVNLVKNKYEKSFVNAILRKINTFKEPTKPNVKANLPLWIYNLLNKQYEENDLNRIIEIYQKIPAVYYRINFNKCNFNDLKDLDINIINDYLFTSKYNLINTSLYENGYFYVQDYNSASLYKHFNLKENDNLLDVCSAPGSKLFNCLDVIKPINAYSNELHPNRLNLIKKMADKLGYEGINYLNEDGVNLVNVLDKKFDHILLDVPCSGLGVINRKPDLKFHIEPKSLDELEALQAKLLENNAKLLKDDGEILYSTCTLNKKENEKQVLKFLNKNLNFKLIKQETIINEYGDAFYYALIKKVNE